MSAGDLDNDGDSDVVATGVFVYADPFMVREERVRLYLNDGLGGFLASPTPAGLGSGLWATAPTVLSLVDLDGDADLDVLIGPSRGKLRMYQNDGSGGFLDVTSTHMPRTGSLPSAVVAADVEGDGDSDLWIASEQGNRLCLNDGSGHFSDVTATHLPGSGRTRSVALADVDGDGDPDALLGNHGYWYCNSRTIPCIGWTYVQEPNRLYINDGAGHFADVTASRLPSHTDTNAVALEDVDGDGDLDAVIGGADRYGQVRLYLNDGLGYFSDVSFLIPPGTAQALALADLDGDGDKDLVIGDQVRDLVFMNTGGGTFSDETSARLPVSRGTKSLALVDVDRDGDVDAVLGKADFASASVQLYLNDGAGYFTGPFEL